jgi:pimeloyl-ACP methyl ester carboxylesterase
MYVLLAGSLVVGCGGSKKSASDAGGADGGAHDSGAPDAGGGDAGVTDAGGGDGGSGLSFASCWLDGTPGLGRCATAKAPAVWSDPQGAAIEVFVKRWSAPHQPAKGQLWLLSGGPGETGAEFEWLVHNRWGEAFPDLDIYLPDHRGTGKSAFVTCAAFSSGTPVTGVPYPALTPAQAASCAASIAHSDGLTTTDAAKDLAMLIDATRAPSQQVFIYGMSYGSYWAQRYLEIRPDQPTAVVFDSTVPASGLDFAAFDRQFDGAARAVLELCKTDATCSSKLGPDPIAKAIAALAAVDSGTCNPGIGPIRQYFGKCVSNLYYFERMLLPASVYRILRCNSGDIAWLGTVAAYLPQPSANPGPGNSDATWYNIGFSDLWPNNPSSADLVASEQSMVGYAGWPPYLASIASSWPKVAHDSYYGQWPSPQLPMLILQGTIDPQTPFGAVVKPHYSGPNQYFVEVARANHVVLLSSPMVDPVEDTCGVKIMQSFLADPSKPPDTSCIAGMAPLDFGNPPADWLSVVGISDLWEN